MRHTDLSDKQRRSFEEALREMVALAGLDEREAPTVLGVTSPLSKEGRTTIAAGLALTLERDYGGGVALLDGHLEGPGVADFFGLGHGPGFFELLQGHASLAQVERRLDGRDLSVITSGAVRMDAARAIRSDRLFEVFGNLRLKYRYVVVDLPPALESTAASVIARRCDAVFVLAAYGNTRPADISRALHLLKDSSLAGVVLNRYAPATPAFVRRAMGLAS